MEHLDDFRATPYWLSSPDLGWVRDTLSRLSIDDRIRQVLIIEGDCFPGAGGSFIRCDSSAETLRTKAERIRSLPGVPVLTVGDLEFNAQGRILDGTDHPCQMAVGAAGEAEAARRMGSIVGREGRICGIDWTFSPVADLALDHRSPGVNTRSFGADARLAARLTAAYVEGVQGEGMAATLKHWPGDGTDERDQHFVTARNRLSVERWRKSFGSVFSAGIQAGVRTVMSAHITFPAYAEEQGVSGREAYLPASLSKLLSIDLLRSELGFRGLVVSDAMVMGGVSSRAKWEDTAPAMVTAGCDMILFPPSEEECLAHFERALSLGILSEERLGEAVARVLALKASLGLHRRQRQEREPVLAPGWTPPQHAKWAADCAAASITLIKDTQALVPISPERTNRILFFVSRSSHFFAPAYPFLLDKLLEERGFETTIYQEGLIVDRDLFDLSIYVIEEQPIFLAESLRIKWPALLGHTRSMMRRYWQDDPVLFISLGSPFHPMEIPACKAIVNAYSAAPATQRALAAVLTGELPFRGRSPVDHFCGYADESEYESTAPKIVEKARITHGQQNT